MVCSELPALSWDVSLEYLYCDIQAVIFHPVLTPGLWEVPNTKDFKMSTQMTLQYIITEIYSGMNL